MTRDCTCRTGCTQCEPYEPGGSGFPEPSWLEKSYKKFKEAYMAVDIPTLTLRVSKAKT